MAAADNYSWEELRPFVDSLRRTGYRGEVRFFASSLSPDTILALREAGIAVDQPRRLRIRLGSRLFAPYNPRPGRLAWRAQPHYRRLIRGVTRHTRDPRSAKARLLGALSNVEVARYYWYFTHLSRLGSRYRNVMLTDVRDVIFLGDPFDFDIDDEVCFFLEDRATIATYEVNRRWVALTYGQQAIDEFGDRPISCSGVTIGTAAGVLEYVTEMVDQLADLPRQMKGIDQGVHNYVVHKGLVTRGRLVGNREGVVLTLALMKSSTARAVLRERAGEVKVLHQYDRRLPKLAKTLASMLSRQA